MLSLSKTLSPLCTCPPNGVALISAEASMVGGDRIVVNVDTSSCGGELPFDSLTFSLRNSTDSTTFPLDPPSLLGGGETQLTALLVTNGQDVPEGPEVEVVVLACDGTEVSIPVSRITPGTLIDGDPLTTVWESNDRTPSSATTTGRFEADLTLCEGPVDPIDSSNIVFMDSGGTISTTDAMLENFIESSGKGTFAFTVPDADAFDLGETYTLTVTVCGGDPQILDPFPIANGTANAMMTGGDFDIPDLPPIPSI
eukprot:Cvel_30664.t2-p1 / transcript=Cvel_30664.t2 / gene=Cvel_30664 / organism=Chromera_velia_CCMP2878 / gene_product=hypothetical protein / transcript_product=hypothetical protein / location=Cvel_scaffold4413:2199-4359(+) / protein_length=254 / sequence_SO=supercontig / SO=protein_coding / is_pseudo=false